MPPENATNREPLQGGSTSPASGQVLLQALPQQLWVLDASLQPIQASASLLEFLGLTLQELQTLGWRQSIHPLDRLEFDLRWQQALLSGRFEMDYRLRDAEGRYRWQLALAQALPRQAGELPCLLGTHTDISTRKEAEARLRDADELWKLALESVGDGVWDWYIQDDVEIYSARILQMYGFAESEIKPSPSELDARTHPDDREQMEHDRAAHFAGQVPIYSNEHRVLCKDGSWKWIHSRGMVISRDAQGRPLRMVGTHTDITQRKQAEALIWHQAHFDALTGLPNRRTLRDRLELMLSSAQREGGRIALLFIDLDHFKEVNDTLGHDMGDALLLQAAERIRSCVRPQETVARMGGDEFTVVLSALADGAEAESVAQKIIQAMAAAFHLQDERVFVSASIGISLFPDDGRQIEELFKHADQALYVAKGAGRNRLGHFTPDLQQAALLRMRLSNDLREALPQGQLSLEYQAIIAMDSRLICKAEALLRWTHPSRGRVGPDLFIPLAESSGLIIEIGEWVFRQAAQQVKDWRQRFNPELQISINKSPVQFRHQQGQADHDQWVSTARELGLADGALAIEITEGLLLEGDSEVNRQLETLREGGFLVSLDDFGTGFSSLSYLHQYAIDLLKIDQRFVRNLRPGTKDLALCKAIITMAHELGLQVVAEGVETPEQFELLRSAGCDYGQGYLFARPLPVEAFEQLLRQGKA